MSDLAIEFDNVRKKFRKGERFDSLRDLVPAMVKWLVPGNHSGELQEREFWALKDISFQLKHGEALGIIGPNGSGKSTILKLISGILTPNAGKIRVCGRLSSLIEVGAGFHPDLTGRENIYLNGAILGMKRKEIDEKFDEIVEFSGLADFIDTPVKRYSSGMYARLGFSVAAHIDPDILLIDEVLSVGDAGFQAKCLLKMHDVVSRGATLLFVSHNVTQVTRLCHTVIVLGRGEIVYRGDPHGAIKTYYDLVSSVSRTTGGSGFSSPADLGISVIPVDSSGCQVSSVPFGAPIRLLADCTLPPGFPESYLTIKIRGYTGENYIILNSERGNITLKPGHQRFVCQLTPCYLFPNAFKVTVSLTDVITGGVLKFGSRQPDLIISVPDNEVASTLLSSENALLDVPTSWEILS